MRRAWTLSRVPVVSACALVLALSCVVPVAGALPTVASSKFEPATSCGCHAGLLEQWSSSMHAKAIADPVFVYKRNEGDKATNGALGPFCNACHAPVAVMGGEAGVKSMSAQAAEGIGCDFCHQVTGTTKPLGNTSQVLEPTGAKRAQLKDAEPPMHAWKYSAFHESAEFCGACHNVDHPGNGLPLEATYTEWKNGPYAKQGVTCQDCHMTPGPGVVKPNSGSVGAGSRQRSHIFTMTFAGGNVGLGDAERATERLKAAATVKLECPQVVDSGDKADVVVTITNVGAGHYLPTGLTEVRQMWLEVNAVTEGGKKVALGRRDFGTVLKDAKGRAPVELWEATAIASDDRIPPLKSVEVSYPFAMSGEKPARIEAVLNYRSMPEELAKAAGVENPVTEMARAQAQVWPSEEARSATTKRTSGGGNGRWALLGGLVALVGLAGVPVVVLASKRRSART